jgi:hypothetical protein
LNSRLRGEAERRRPDADTVRVNFFAILLLVLIVGVAPAVAIWRLVR